MWFADTTAFSVQCSVFRQAWKPADHVEEPETCWQTLMPRPFDPWLRLLPVVGAHRVAGGEWGQHLHQRPLHAQHGFARRGICHARPSGNRSWPVRPRLVDMSNWWTNTRTLGRVSTLAGCGINGRVQRGSSVQRRVRRGGWCLHCCDVVDVVLQFLPLSCPSSRWPSHPPPTASKHTSMFCHEWWTRRWNVHLLVNETILQNKKFKKMPRTQNIIFKVC